MKQSLLFVATTPFAANAFLRTHLVALSKPFDVTLCVNLHAYPLNEEINQHVRVVHVDFERKVSPWQDLKSLLQLLQLSLRLRPHAIHSITPKAGLLAMLAGFLSGVPLRCHTFTGQVWTNKKGVKRWLLKLFDRLIVLLATQVFADSASQCRFLQAQRVVRTGGIEVLGAGSIAGVDLGQFKPDPACRHRLRTQLGTPNDTIVFLFVGRLARDKGVFDLLSAFAQALPAQAISTSSPWELWMVGPDEEGLLIQLQGIGLQTGGTVRWCGMSLYPQQYFAAADVLVLPSHREGFGSVIIEAAACAIPTIAYRIDGVIDAVVEEQTGILVEKGDINAFAGAMHELAENTPKRLRLGAQALDRARTRFSSIAVTEEWRRFYSARLTGAHDIPAN